MVFGETLSSGVDAAIVVLLPTISRRARRVGRHTLVKFITCPAPRLKSRHRRRIGPQRLKFRHKVFDRRSLDRKEEANRLHGVEMNPMPWPREAPVHCKSKWRPIG